MAARAPEGTTRVAARPRNVVHVANARRSTGRIFSAHIEAKLTSSVDLERKGRYASLQ
jgi:hypothetical protein